jgi:phosphatidylglycerophosphate synthase
MAFIRSDISRRWLPHTLAVLGSPLAEFTATTVALSVGMIALAVLVFGSGPGATVVALLSFGISAAVAARALHRTYPHDRLGLCNVITLARLALTASLVAPLISGAQPSWAVFAVAVVALGLDGFDGWLARRQGYVSDFGARFDMEVDSLLALVLSASAAVVSGLGPVAILLGLPRYAFAAAAWRLPWMHRPLPPRFSRKVVCVLQLGALIALQAPILPVGLAVALVSLAAAALAWSFAVDIAWLWRRRG